jgi:hypothetical protein
LPVYVDDSSSGSRSETEARNWDHASNQVVL